MTKEEQKINIRAEKGRDEKQERIRDDKSREEKRRAE